MAEKIRVGLIGYGYASKTFHAPLIVGTPGMILSAIFSSDASKVHADWPLMTVVDSPQALFNDPSIDLIVIPTPNDTHFSLAQQAMAAGIPAEDGPGGGAGPGPGGSRTGPDGGSIPAEAKEPGAPPMAAAPPPGPPPGP